MLRVIAPSPSTFPLKASASGNPTWTVWLCCARDQHAEGSVQNIGPQACSAVLQFATQHTGVFMTVLTLDVLNPRPIGEKESMMQLVAFLIRKVCLLLGFDIGISISVHLLMRYVSDR